MSGRARPTTRTALITGGSRGIGRALVEAFREAGYRVAASGTTDESAAQSGADVAVACDVSKKSDVRAFVDAALSLSGSIDVVINNAGIAGENSLDDDDDTLWYRIVDVNLHGTYLVTKACLPHVPDGGRILHIASILGLIGVPEQSAYCASKHAVVGFTRSLASALAPRRITVNAICPGWVETDMAAQRARELSTTLDGLARGVPLGRMVTAREVARYARFLASDDAAMITGQALAIDGGALT